MECFCGMFVGLFLWWFCKVVLWWLFRDSCKSGCVVGMYLKARRSL